MPRTVDGMTDLPFGFNSQDPDDRGKRDDPSGRSGGESPFGVGPGGMPGFDMGSLGQMLSQLGQMLSQASQHSSGPVNYDLAKQLALQQINSGGRDQPPSAGQHDATTEAFRLAELWLDPVTTFPVGAQSVRTWSAKDWVDSTLPTWRRLCDPVARQVSSAWTDMLPAEAKQNAGPLLSMLGQMGGMAYGSQLGSALGQFASEVLTSTDIGLPLGEPRTAALLPSNIDRFTQGLDRPANEVLVFLAAREAAHLRLFSHVPWLRQRLLATVEEFAHGIRVDPNAMEELAGKVDPSNPASLEEAMRSGLLEPRSTPEQKQALTRLETLLALIEGWVDLVVGEALGDRLPGADALRETLRRRRASGGPAEQAFATLVGLELRPRQLRAAATLWRGLTDRHGVEQRDSVWNHPDLMPTSADLDDPVDFVEHFGRASSELDDPLAALRRAEESAAAGDASSGGEERTDDDQDDQGRGGGERP